MAFAPVTPEKMTWRARAYLTIAGTRSLLVGVLLFTAPGVFSTDAFRVIRAVFDDHLWLWSATFTLTGLAFAWAATRGAETTARVALTASAASLASWSVGFWLSYRLGGQVTPLGVILCGSAALSDLVICAYPLRSPFEPILREVAHQTGK